MTPSIPASALSPVDSMCPAVPYYIAPRTFRTSVSKFFGVSCMTRSRISVTSALWTMATVASMISFGVSVSVSAYVWAQRSSQAASDQRIGTWVGVQGECERKQLVVHAGVLVCHAQKCPYRRRQSRRTTGSPGEDTTWRSGPPRRPGFRGGPLFPGVGAGRRTETVR